MTMDVKAELLNLIPDARRVSTGESIREQHSHDYSYHRPSLPDAVVFPQTREEIAGVLKFASEHQIPVTATGVLTSLEGHVVPVHAGISMDFTQMNRILEVRPKDFIVRVQPGVTRTELNKGLKPYGLQFPLDPGADATLGGMAATNASGTTAVRYGVMRDQVLDLEVALADGSIIHTGGMAAKSSAGYNLTGLFVGSEGTLGLITELTLKVRPVPEYTVATRVVFPSLAEASEAAYSIMSSGVMIGRIELVDEYTVQAVNRAKGTHYTEQPTLFLEFHGNKTAIQSDADIVMELCRDAGCVDVVSETDTKLRNQLWEARHDAALAVIQTAPSKKMKVTDVVVPLSELPDAIKTAREVIDMYGVYGAIMGHVGDGNYHVIFMVDPDDEAEIRVADEINDKIVQYALERGGTCTGEHGVGMGKVSYLAREHAETLPWMMQLKRLFDPGNILNPGKLFSEHH